jgi:hypothetical protein
VDRAAVITTIAVAWTVMAFRAGTPAIVQAFNDLGFFLFLYTWPPFGILMVIIAIAILPDVNPVPIFPRWVAYYNVYAALGMAPASFMGLFNTGPRARRAGYSVHTLQKCPIEVEHGAEAPSVPQVVGGRARRRTGCERLG